jgi:hypothetical protein
MAEPIPASLVQMVNEGRYDQASAILGPAAAQAAQ